MRYWHISNATAALALLSCTGGDSGSDDPSLIHTVTRGDLAITVRERAEVQASRDTRVRSQLEGRATLIHLIPEGTVVEKGQKLAELDASEIAEKRAGQAIDVAKVEAALEQARKNFEIMEKELLAAERTAENRLQIARMRVAKFMGDRPRTGDGERLAAIGTNRDLITKLAELIAEEAQADPTIRLKYANLIDQLKAFLPTEEDLGLAMGEMANQVLQQIEEISLTRADLALAEDTLGHSRKLAVKGFITTNELARDEINFKRQLSKVTVAWNTLQLLIKFTLPETLIGLQQEEENADLGLESVRATNDARRVKEAAELKSLEAEHVLAVGRLENWDQQIENAVLFAPTPGMVVYGRWDWDEPVYEGMQVRQRQEVVILPDVSEMIAELKVHEAQIDKVAVSQRATIKVDAFPDRSFGGRVSKVSSLPDPNPRNRDLKVFDVVVLLDVDNSDGALRPGMNATVAIGVGVLKDVLNVPLPAIERSGDAHFVWKVGPSGPLATEVTLGGNNLTHVEVLAGLQEGERIHLVRPTGAKLPPAAAEKPAAPARSPVEGDAQAIPANAVEDSASAANQ